MIQRTVQLTIGLAAMVLACAAASAPAERVTTLAPFSHAALIPANADTSSIRLERVKLVKVPTRIRFVDGSADCEHEQSFRDPGGSGYCPAVNLDGVAEAYELSFSYTGEPMASDEYGSRNFTFSVYFRPEELSAQVRQEVSKRRNTATLAEIFEVKASRPLGERIVTDEASSRLCEGFYRDGSWVQTDRDCKDQIRTKTVTAPADYITVRVGSRLSDRATR